MSFPQNIAKCTFCEWGADAGKACNGPCLCQKDPKGRDIAEIAQKGNCPLELFTEAGPLPASAPLLAGDVVEHIIKRFGADRLAEIMTKKSFRNRKCPRCNRRREWLNRFDRKVRNWLFRNAG